MKFIFLLIMGFKNTFIWIFVLTRLPTATFSLDPEKSKVPLLQCQGRPNIIFIVADDAGWNDFSFHGSPQIPTPNIDALALSGIILNNYYAAPLCTPTRGSIMTGKHPIHIKLQHYVITGGMEGGIPLEDKLLPQYLKELGYSTHLVGKWHLGHSRRVYTPTYRGFDTHYGNWLGAQDYYDHFYKETMGFGYDFRKNMEVDHEGFGVYTTDLYTNEAIRLIQAHPKDKPLFLMINHIAPHSSNDYNPLQAPPENIEKFEDTIDFRPRRIYAGMVDRLDESIGDVIDALGTAGMLDNSIVVFTSDNGGAAEGYNNNYASNWPLRGVKNSLWEGGTRVAGFVWSNFLPQKVSMDMMHVQDWLPTIFEAAGGNMSKLVNIDGVSQWGAFQGKGNEDQVRTEFLYNIDDKYNNSAYRSGPWKVLQGNVTSLDLGARFHYDGWYGPSGRSNSTSVHHLIPRIFNSTSAKALARIGVTFDPVKLLVQQMKAEAKCDLPLERAVCDPYNSPCLFNILEDPCEFNNLASQYPEILNRLLLAIETINQTAVPPLSRFAYPEAAPRYWGHTWTNWQDHVTQNISNSL